MKRTTLFLFFFAVLGVALGGLYYSQRRRKPTPVSPNAILNIAADAERDLSRGPMKLTRLSDEQEIEIGNELAARYGTQFQKFSPEEEALEAYVRRVGAGVAAHAHRRLPYQFHLIASPAMMNAFALPGGHVYIGKGFTELMETEDELASVLAHEVEHIDNYHCVERVQIEAQLKNFHLDAMGELIKIPMELWQAGYHKDEELEADREGIYLAEQAGYSPFGAVKLFQKFSELRDEYVIHAQSPEQELSQLAIQSLEGYFRSHPLPSERLAQANGIIAHEHWENRTDQKPFRIAYEVHNGAYVKSSP